MLGVDLKPTFINEKGLPMDHEVDVSYWKCQNGHSLGQVVRNGSNIRILLLYRNAIDPCKDEMSVQRDVFCRVEGYVADVSCSICGSTRTWMPGEESLNRLIERVKRQNIE